MPLQEMTSVMGFQVLSVDAELTKAALAGMSLMHLHLHFYATLQIVLCLF